MSLIIQPRMGVTIESESISPITRSGKTIPGTLPLPEGGEGGGGTLVFSDGFTRPDENLDSSENWTQFPSFFAAVPLQVVSNALQSSTGSQFGTVPVYGIVPSLHDFISEQWCRAELVTLPVGEKHLALAVRCSATAGGTDNAAIGAHVSSNGSIEVISRNTSTQVSNGITSAGAISNGDVLGIHIDESDNVTVYVNGSSVLSVTSGGVSEDENQPGFAGDTPNVTAVSAVFDNFEAGEGAFPN